MITGNSIVRLSEHLSVADLSGEAVLLDVQTGKYFGVNEVGAAIIRLLDQPRLVLEIEDAIGGQFTGQNFPIGVDIVAFLQSLNDHDLLRLQ